MKGNDRVCSMELQQYKFSNDSFPQHFFGATVCGLQFYLGKFQFVILAILYVMTLTTPLHSIFPHSRYLTIVTLTLQLHGCSRLDFKPQRSHGPECSIVVSVYKNTICSQQVKIQIMFTNSQNITDILTDELKTIENLVVCQTDVLRQLIFTNLSAPLEYCNVTK